MRKLPFLALSVTCLVASACSSSGGIATPGDFDTQISIAGCQRAARCGFIGASEEKQCETSQQMTLKQYPPAYSLAEAVASKRLAFDAGAAQRCADLFRAAGCSVDAQNTVAASDACAKIYKPMVAVGGACKDFGECIGGFCDQGMNGQSGCAGTCKAFTAVGAACDPQAPSCDANSFCDGTKKVCTANVGSGQPCGDAQCATGLFCKGVQTDMNGNITKQGTCTGPGKAGDACQLFLFGNTDCGPGLFCDQSAMSPVCTPFVAAGGACSSVGDCADGLTCVGLLVDMNGNVTTKGKCGPFLDIGKACTDPAAGEPGCPFDSVCDPMKKVCTLVGIAGADCSMTGTNGQCGTNLYCDQTSMKCTAQPALGQACTPPPANSFGADPCHDGSCDATTKVCTLVCM